MAIRQILSLCFVGNTTTRLIWCGKIVLSDKKLVARQFLYFSSRFWVPPELPHGPQKQPQPSRVSLNKQKEKIHIGRFPPCIWAKWGRFVIFHVLCLLAYGDTHFSCCFFPVSDYPGIPAHCKQGKTHNNDKSTLFYPPHPPPPV